MSAGISPMSGLGVSCKHDRPPSGNKTSQALSESVMTGFSFRVAGRPGVDFHSSTVADKSFLIGTNFDALSLIFPGTGV